MEWSCWEWCFFFKNLVIKQLTWQLSVQVYTNLEGNRSHVVNTGWAMLALIDAGQVHFNSYNHIYIDGDISWIYLFFGM